MTTNKRSSSNQAKGRHSKYLHRHRWSDIDGQEMKEFRSPLSSTEKSKISAEAQGEDFGYRYAQEQLRYEDILHPDEKSIPQGYDHLCRDPENGDLVVMEYKGQNSDKSKLQKREDWTAVTAEKILEAKLFPYRNVSEYERQFAEQVREALERGDRVRYEVVRTYVDEKTGDFWTQLEESKLIEKELNAEGVGEKINTFDYSHPKMFDDSDEIKINPYEFLHHQDDDDTEEQNEDDESDLDNLENNDENYENSEDAESSDEKVNPYEFLHHQDDDDTVEQNEDDESDLDNLENNDQNHENSEDAELSGEKVNPFADSNENAESKYEGSESDESDEDDD